MITITTSQRKATVITIKDGKALTDTFETDFTDARQLKKAYAEHTEVDQKYVIVDGIKVVHSKVKFDITGEQAIKALKDAGFEQVSE